MSTALVYWSTHDIPPSVIDTNFGYNTEDDSYFKPALRELYTAKYRRRHEGQLYGSWFRKRLEKQDYHINFRLIGINKLTDDPTCGHSYHHIKIFSGQTYYEHIHDHVFGSDEIGREREANFENFDSVADFIRHAHDILQAIDLDRFMDFESRNASLRYDFKENILYVVSKNHLLTAYRPKDMVHHLFKLFLKIHKS